MYKVLVAGSGKIGSVIGFLLASSKAYEVYFVDVDIKGTDVVRVLNVFSDIKACIVDVTDESLLKKYIKKYNIDAIISSLPFFLNQNIAKVAIENNVHYFDLTEDIATTTAVRKMANNAQCAVVPQCGLAPGFISIAANTLLQKLDKCHHAKLRVGAIPQHTNNGLHYSLTWSTDGLINEYANVCQGIVAGKVTNIMPLEALETIYLDGEKYEAFNTSGGIGSLTQAYKGKIDTLNYKTMRYPGHCEKFKFLMNDLRLKDRPQWLKEILESAIPKTYQDMVIIYISVEGIKDSELIEFSFAKKIYPVLINNNEFSAIQISTASGVCAVVDLTLSQNKRGLIDQESFYLDDVLKNRFGKYYA